MSLAEDFIDKEDHSVGMAQLPPVGEVPGARRRRMVRRSSVPSARSAPGVVGASAAPARPPKQPRSSDQRVGRRRRGEGRRGSSSRQRKSQRIVWATSVTRSVPSGHRPTAWERRVTSRCSGGSTSAGATRSRWPSCATRSRPPGSTGSPPTSSPATCCSSPTRRERSLEDDIEGMLERRFGVPPRRGGAVAPAASQRRREVRPRASGAPDTYHSDAMFLKAPLTSGQAMRVVDLRDGVDQAWPGTGVALLRPPVANVARRAGCRSIMGTPEYQQMTIRSWTTTTKLLGLLDERR